MVLSCDEKLKEKTIKYINKKSDEMFLARASDTFEREFTYAQIRAILDRIKRDVYDI